MFANAVFINQGRGGEYGLGKQTGEMRNLKKKLLSCQNPHCNLLLPLFECFLGWFMVCFFCLVVVFFSLLSHASPPLIVTLSHFLGKPLFCDGIPQWRRPHVPYTELS